MAAAALPASRRDDYRALYESFRWEIPAQFNIAEACCGRWARDPTTMDRIAVYTEHEDGLRNAHSFAYIQAEANRLSAALRALGVARGDRVAIVMPQRIETVIAHMAIYQLGAIAMPLSMLFGPEALAYRIAHSEAGVAIADETSIDNLLAARPECPTLATVIAAGDARGRGDHDWDLLLAAQLPSFVAEQTKADEAAVLIYTSGTTGPPKGALIPHRALIGNLTGFVCSQNWYPQHDDVFWSPADWAWTGGLWDALMPALYFGKPIVGYQGRFSAERAFELLERYAVTNTFLFPTALKQMMKACPEPRRHYDIRLRALMSAGEAVGETVFAWCRDALGVLVNEMFGQTEINYIVGNCTAQNDDERLGWPARPGSMGRPYPGHRVQVVDDEGRPCAPGEDGEVAVCATDGAGHPDPVFFLGYWKNEAATAAKYAERDGLRWCRTGDLARVDADGYLWYQGRADDVFKSSGYRIGPSEIENCLLKHPAVSNCAVVPSPDPERGAVVKAFVVLTPSVARSFDGDAALVAELQAHVRGQLAPYEYPKAIEFIDQLPMTTTGKIQRRVLRLLEEERAAERLR
ncbi:putative AMP-dependent synthetase and ligase [Cupriavidus taiwanensis]|uniref:AMP-dependent synthetase and ligase n=1 Tax=Cupriavidus taiwanensis TaxID=164546 RepID=A0A375DYW1_9BURK|nr:AMP-binding protein [Cupriavidus taiwanensis]SOZ50112.1 putative AMP-dependent synthetase and ligase [Cupriavidus taiwanensis]SOZ50855.1 putative AMP-dependent synthetase and ligase [Cupriavidus taiwanensis]SOZ53517.1 putative AMP-dependent synthetase and ligase [Cupriavidus taiwanensis]SPA04075.1 putative AMP-dependent synthetase and ligase [Cupriavidus taiwanensis]